MTLSIPLFEFECPSFSKYLPDKNITSLYGELSDGVNYSSTLQQQVEQGYGFFVFLVQAGDECIEEPQTVYFGSFNEIGLALWQCSVLLATRTVTAECFKGHSFGFPPAPPACGFVSASPPTHTSTTILANLIDTTVFDYWSYVDPGSMQISSRTEVFLSTAPDGFINGVSGISSPSRPGSSLHIRHKACTLEFGRRITTHFLKFIRIAHPARPSVRNEAVSTHKTSLLSGRVKLHVCREPALVSFVSTSVGYPANWARCPGMMALIFAFRFVPIIDFEKMVLIHVRFGGSEITTPSSVPKSWGQYSMFLYDLHRFYLLSNL
ncbi:hypothetical protein BDZ45DRAFT_752944 [Acephala macrosclerotiorum]|nr:hypothetical protein BDZ45DRAFT_752944 [Acephala macrosclerotiorum]